MEGSMPTQTFLNLNYEKQETILFVAIEEFANNTFNEASMNRIVKKAKIPKGSLYQYFKDKKDLYLYLIEISTKKKIEFLEEQAIDVNFDDFFKGFSSLMYLGVQFSIKHPQLSKLIKHADQSVEDESIRLMQSANQQFLLQLIEDAQKRKQLDSSNDAETIAFILNTMTTNFSMYLNQRYSSDYDKEDILEAIDSVLQAIQNGIAK